MANDIHQRDPYKVSLLFNQSQNSIDIFLYPLFGICSLSAQHLYLIFSAMIHLKMALKQYLLYFLL